ncbi:MAG: class I SAM-dependent methyltransferase [Myxococcota bacterium]
MTDIRYTGTELELFADAKKWKSYLADIIGPMLIGPVLEVGAGIGSTARALCPPEHSSWTCLEPDPEMAARLREDATSGRLPTCCHIVQGDTGVFCSGETFGTVLYVDVLEHIEDDRAELARASSLLAPGGVLIVMSPAHPFLFSPFDQAVGHFRRYTRASLRAVAPPELTLQRLDYLDSVGLLASAANKLLLGQSTPTASQIRIWDRGMVLVSRRLDPVLRHRVGKSVLGIWSRQP